MAVGWLVLICLSFFFLGHTCFLLSHLLPLVVTLAYSCYTWLLLLSRLLALVVTELVKEREKKSAFSLYTAELAFFGRLSPVERVDDTTK